MGDDPPTSPRQGRGFTPQAAPGGRDEVGAWTDQDDEQLRDAKAIAARLDRALVGYLVAEMTVDPGLSNNTDAGMAALVKACCLQEEEIVQLACRRKEHSANGRLGPRERVSPASSDQRQRPSPEAAVEGAVTRLAPTWTADDKQRLINAEEAAAASYRLLAQHLIGMGILDGVPFNAAHPDFTSIIARQDRAWAAVHELNLRRKEVESNRRPPIVPPAQPWTRPWVGCQLTRLCGWLKGGRIYVLAATILAWIGLYTASAVIAFLAFGEENGSPAVKHKALAEAFSISALAVGVLLQAYMAWPAREHIRNYITGGMRRDT